MSQSHFLDVRTIPEPQHYGLIFDRLDALEVGQILVVQGALEPVALCEQVETLYSEQMEWCYLEAASLENGPQVFHLELTRRASAPEGWNRVTAPKGLRPNTPLSPSTTPVQLDLLEQLKLATFSGPQWGYECEDLDLTLLSWEAGRSIEPHINEEVDVVWIGLEGTGVALVNGERHELQPGELLLVPKGAVRAIEAVGERFSYLSVHRRRRGLMPTFEGKSLT